MAAAAPRVSPRFFRRAQAHGFCVPDIPADVRAKCVAGTSTRVLDGRFVADALVAQCGALVAQKKGQGGRVPKLVVVLAGEDPASAVYVGNKEKMFAKAGFESETLKIASCDTTLEGLLSVVGELNARADVDGILVQLPLPAGIPAHVVLAAIDPRKDVDGFLKENMGLLALGDFSGALPCTPFGIMVLLAAHGIPLESKRAVVVGRSNIVGKPMSLLLLGEDSTVTVAHSRTTDLAALTREADIVIAAAGRPLLLGKEHVKAGAVVVDVGMHRKSDGKLCGDVDATFETGVAGKASALTPVPGGVGPMTIAMLLVNTAAAAWSKPLS
ncbi:MAG: bifunctional 5,10-methylenetetrahydrofolate dehydrogenase/5,10-methenyltetrahydrofolate cyclohydrolase [Silvanigrellales bacterium]|nr:bifunctional 5,10-methylenetetrahydrofolate dehydrogenase/5,10-methenyltetrahydrofolate cyclohydrolase [Silvanigrellales bacterium]